ncbi:ANTAR domain-containing response regulator [Ornithinicoccus hortensis]|uniref:Response regulator receiver and ANTAR domain protein n=1 Tax=Ornithinicoccus hortensis TaxID=82346 RepID=A0A542YSM7_9MICO|nr:response regulator receiver and ANTAR domain protein [Ornithinicoccus hortensis]
MTNKPAAQDPVEDADPAVEPPTSDADAAAAVETEPAEDAPATDTVTEEPAQGAGLRIVVAEDEALIRMDLAEMLEEAGHQVVGQAANGEQAVDLAREHRPDIVVMDIKMPVMDGLTAAEILGKESLAPVVMLTAFSDRTLVERAREAGVMAYVVKPFTANDILPAIDIARPRWTEFQALQAEVADLTERFETRKLLDRAKGLLMSTSKLTEAEAFRLIQKAAMDRRQSMREVAEAIIESLDKGKKKKK